MSTTKAAAAVKYVPEQVRMDMPRYAKMVFENLPGKVAKYNVEGTEIQGRRRFIRSNAAKNFMKAEKARIASALQSKYHGKNIYAYNHIKTKQVVYSLTRDLQYNSVIKQLIYHGKKTIPPSIRKDVWQPYFSVHFPDAISGLKAFKRLVEFSKLQQLTPNSSRITVTEEFLEKQRPKDPDQIEGWERNNLYTVGFIMNKRQRAQELMNQRATSVADLAAVLALRSTDLEEASEPKTDEEKLKHLSKKKKAALGRLRRVEAGIQKSKEELIEKTEAWVKKRLHLTNPLYTTAESEWHPETVAHNQIDISGVEVHTFPDPASVKVLWADRSDALYAQEWPVGALHGELMPAIETRHIIGYEKPGSLGTEAGPFEEEIQDDSPKIEDLDLEKKAPLWEPKVEEPSDGVMDKLKFWKK